MKFCQISIIKDHFNNILSFLVSQETEVLSQTRNGENVKITITLTNELPPSSPVCLQFYNILFKRSAAQWNQYLSSGGSFHP